MSTNDPSTAAGALNAMRRSREINAAIGETHDVVVIGGGITGAGIALDAVTRGLSVALVERHDLASGTSRWSSKLVHGGLRYLASGAVGIAMESANERRILIERTAPHLVHPLAFVIPLTPGLGTSAARQAAIGGKLGDALRVAARTRRSTLPSSGRLDAPQTLRLLPGVLSDGLRGGLLTWDGQLEDDARLVIGIARTAAAYGAKILTRLEASDVTAHSVTCTDGLTGQTLTLRARHVINATGVWASAVDPSVKLRPSKGVHVVLPAAVLGLPSAALVVPVPGERARYVLALPQPDATVLVGLTDDPLVGPIPDEPPVDAHEVDFLLDILNGVLASRVGPDDVIGRFAGLRPLLDTSDGATADISRKHAVIDGPEGVLTIVGGKLTTYRRMAQDTLDALAARGLAMGPCRTKHLGILGAGPVSPSLRAQHPRLVRRYGSEAAVLAELIAARPELNDPVAEGVPSLKAEFAFGVSHEGALLAEDLVARRTRLDFVDAWLEAAMPAAAQALALERA